MSALSMLLMCILWLENPCWIILFLFFFFYSLLWINQQTLRALLKRMSLTLTHSHSSQWNNSTVSGAALIFAKYQIMSWMTTMIVPTTHKGMIIINCSSTPVMKVLIFGGIFTKFHMPLFVIWLKVKDNLYNSLWVVCLE